MTLQRICVFCGSKAGTDSRNTDTARALGRAIVDAGCELVYGGGGIGMMGILADSVAEAGGRVIAIIPQFLDDWEVGRRQSDEFIITESMHERKAMMAEKADAFVVLAGGLGTLDETFEIITWKQLGLHDKPVIILNERQYWQGFIDLVDRMIGEGYVADKDRELFAVADSVDDVMPLIRAELG